MHGQAMDRSNTISGMDSARGALNAFANRVHISAHNIANVSTLGFAPVSGTLADGPNGWGTRLYSLKQDGINLLEATSGNPARRGHQPSGTDLGREIVSLLGDQRSFQANAVTIRAADAMLGTLLELKA